MLEQGYCIRQATGADGDAICALMRRAFDYGDGSNAALNVAWWHWKYFQNPEGRYGVVCEGPGGRLLGHYGGVPSKVWLEGRELTFSQNCDSCTDPDVRRGLRNPGLFVRLAQAFASTFAGHGNHAVMYGLPIRSAHRIGARYLDYWLLRSQLGLVLEHTSSLPPDDEQLVVEPSGSLPGDLDAFLATQRPAFRCHAERSHAFLSWRFLNHPSVTYALATVRSAGNGGLRGYAVYRNAKFMGRDFGLLMDVMTAPDDDAALIALVRWAAGRTAADGMRGLFTLAAPPLPWFERLQRWGFRAQTTEYVLAVRTYAAVEPAYLLANWTYTLADFDIL
ncbi:MAG TPA: hypothetical protein VFT55_03675 [Planctomycetota bacterium]|nr:hypothetical protein [Planctomycetota bacterium]